MTNNTTAMNGSNNYYKTRCRGLKDEFIKSLRLQKKEKLKSAPSLQKVTGEENAGRNLISIYILYIYIYIYIVGMCNFKLNEMKRRINLKDKMILQNMF